MPTSSRAGVVHFHGRSNGETLCFQSIPPSHSTHCGGSVRFRDDVGIVPYIRVKLRTTQRTLHQSRFFGEAVEFLGLPLFRGCRLGGGDVSPAADIALTRLI